MKAPAPWKENKRSNPVQEKVNALLSSNYPSVLYWYKLEILLYALKTIGKHEVSTDIRLVLKYVRPLLHKQGWFIGGKLKKSSTFYFLQKWNEGAGKRNWNPLFHSNQNHKQFASNYTLSHNRRHWLNTMIHYYKIPHVECIKLLKESQMKFAYFQKWH